MLHHFLRDKVFKHQWTVIYNILLAHSSNYHKQNMSLTVTHESQSSLSLITGNHRDMTTPHIIHTNRATAYNTIDVKLVWNLMSTLTVMVENRNTRIQCWWVTQCTLVLSVFMARIFIIYCNALFFNILYHLYTFIMDVVCCQAVFGLYSICYIRWL